MKIQMKFQKILTIVSLVVAALTFVFAISFLSGGLSAIQTYRFENIEIETAGVDTFVNSCQSFVGTLIVLSIILICTVLLLYITSTNSRRKYYITNYVAIGIFALIAVVWSVYTLIYLCILLGQYAAIDWEELMAVYEMYIASNYPNPDKDYTTFILGFVMLVVVLADVAVWALNFIWKLKLMKGEKALLEQGLVKEVA